MKRIKSLSLCIIAIFALLTACSTADKPITAAELLDLGEKYLLELDYEQAIIAFNRVIEVEPMNPRGYTGVADAYIGLKQPDTAIAILQQGFERTDDDSIRKMLVELGVDESNINPFVPSQSDNMGENDTDNLTGKSEFTFDDVSAWGYPWGMGASELALSDLFNHPSDDVGVSTGANSHAERVIKWIWITDDSFLGPRGIKVGMSLEEAINLFKCDNPDVLNHANNPSSEWVGNEDNNHGALYVIWSEHIAYWNGWIPQGYFNAWEGGNANLSYTAVGQSGSIQFDIKIQNNVVSEMSINYEYDKHSDFNSITQPENINLINFESITVLSRSVFDIFEMNMDTVVGIARNQGYDFSPWGDDGEMYRGTFGGSRYTPDIELTIVQRAEDSNVVHFMYDTGWQNRTQIGQTGIGSIDMSDNMSTFLSKWGFPNASEMVEYLMQFTGKYYNDFSFEWRDQIDNYDVTISPEYFWEWDEEPFDGRWSIGFRSTSHVGFSLTFSFENERMLNYHISRYPENVANWR